MCDIIWAGVRSLKRGPRLEHSKQQPHLNFAQCQEPLSKLSRFVCFSVFFPLYQLECRIEFHLMNVSGRPKVYLNFWPNQISDHTQTSGKIKEGWDEEVGRAEVGHWNEERIRGWNNLGFICPDFTPLFTHWLALVTLEFESLIWITHFNLDQRPGFRFRD